MLTVGAPFMNVKAQRAHRDRSSFAGLEGNTDFFLQCGNAVLFIMNERISEQRLKEKTTFHRPQLQRTGWMETHWGWSENGSRFPVTHPAMYVCVHPAPSPAPCLSLTPPLLLGRVIRRAAVFLRSLVYSELSGQRKWANI